MDRKSFGFLLVFCSILVGVTAKTRCFKVSGTLKCKMNPQLSGDHTAVTLMDRDRGPDDDDKLGWELPELSGFFEVSGCGYDFSPWNNPDPYLIIDHKCTSHGRYAIFKQSVAQNIYAPNVVEVGEIELDDRET